MLHIAVTWGPSPNPPLGQQHTRCANRRYSPPVLCCDKRLIADDSAQLAMKPPLCRRWQDVAELRLYRTAFSINQNAIRTGTGFRKRTGKARRAALRDEAARIGANVGCSQRVSH